MMRYLHILTFVNLAIALACNSNSTSMGTSGNQTERQGEGAFGSADLGQQGWVGSIFQIPKGTSRLPDFSRMKSMDSLVTPQLDIQPRTFSAGFPEMPDLVEWFGIRFEATLIIPKQGCNCQFELNSDDGSKLTINNKLVIDNDGTHDPMQKSGSIKLPGGRHSIQVDYFQGPRDQIALQLFIKTKESDTKKILPASMIERPDQ